MTISEERNNGMEDIRNEYMRITRRANREVERRVLRGIPRIQALTELAQEIINGNYDAIHSPPLRGSSVRRRPSMIAVVRALTDLNNARSREARALISPIRTLRSTTRTNFGNVVRNLEPELTAPRSQNQQTVSAENRSSLRTMLLNRIQNKGRIINSRSRNTNQRDRTPTPRKSANKRVRAQTPRRNTNDPERAYPPRRTANDSEGTHPPRRTVNDLERTHPARRSENVVERIQLPGRTENVPERTPPPRRTTNALERTPPPRRTTNVLERIPPPRWIANAPDRSPPPIWIANAPERTPPPRRTPNAPERTPPPRRTANAQERTSFHRRNANDPERTPPPRGIVNDPERTLPPLHFEHIPAYQYNPDTFNPSQLSLVEAVHVMNFFNTNDDREYKLIRTTLLGFSIKIYGLEVCVRQDLSIAVLFFIEKYFNIQPSIALCIRPVYDRQADNVVGVLFERYTEARMILVRRHALDNTRYRVAANDMSDWIVFNYKFPNSPPSPSP